MNRIRQDQPRRNLDFIQEILKLKEIEISCRKFTNIGNSMMKCEKKLLRIADKKKKTIMFFSSTIPLSFISQAVALVRTQHAKISKTSSKEYIMKD